MARPRSGKERTELFPRDEEQLSELEQCKARLAQVVDEVLYCEAEIENGKRRNKFLKQAIADSTAVHGALVQALVRYVEVCEKDSHIANDSLARKAKNWVDQNMSRLREYQQVLQRGLVDEKIQLPPASFPLARRGEQDDLELDLETERLDLKKQSVFRPIPHYNAERALSSPPSQSKEWEKERTHLTSKIHALEEELRRVQGRQAWPFTDDHLSFSDGFGMSSNSVDIKNAPPTQRENGSTTTSFDPSRLHQLLREQEERFEKQKSALMNQARVELEDAERQIERLRKELERYVVTRDPLHETRIIPQDIDNENPNEYSSRSPENGQIRIHRDGEIEFGEDLSRIFHEHERNKKDGSDLEHSAAIKRIKELEDACARERSLNEKLKRQLDRMLLEKDDAVEKLDELELTQELNHEGLQSERRKHLALRQELDRARRERETFAREQRASERRHEAIMEEMRKVMEERDRAIADKDSARKEQLQALQECEHVKMEMENALAKRDQALADLRAAKSEAEATIKQLRVETRNKVGLVHDLQVLKGQYETLRMERDAAITEQQHAMNRVDEAIAARKHANEARDQALEKANSLQDDVAKFKVQLERERQSALEIQEKLDKATELGAQFRDELERAREKSEHLRNDTELAKQERLSALQDREAAQRQCKALSEEMKSVLRVRDIALQQRDATMKEFEELKREFEQTHDEMKMLEQSRDLSNEQSTKALQQLALANQKNKAEHDAANTILFENYADSLQAIPTKSPWKQNTKRSTEVATGEEHARLMQRVAKLEAELAAANNNNKQLQQLMETLGDRNAVSIQQYSDELGKAKIIVQREREELQHAKASIVKVSHALATLHEDIRAVAISVRSLSEPEVRTSGYSPSSASIGSNRSTLEDVIGTAIPTATPSQSLKSCISTVIEQASATQSEVGNVLHHCRRATSSFYQTLESQRRANRAIEQLRQDLETSQHTCNDLRETLQRTNSNGEVLRLAEVDQHKRLVENERKRAEEAIKQLEALESDYVRDVKSLEEKLEQALKLNTTFSTAPSTALSEGDNSLQNQGDEIAKLRQSLSSVRLENQTLRDSNARLEQACFEQAKELSALEEQMELRNRQRLQVFPDGSDARQAQQTMETVRLYQRQCENYEKQIDHERAQLRDTLARLQKANERIEHLQDRLDKTISGVDRFQKERDRLMHEVDTAAAHLKLVAKQKSDAAKELEQVYQSLSELERELEASRHENDMLRKRAPTSLQPRSLRRRSRDPSPGEDQPFVVGKSHVRVTRSGSIVIEAPSHRGSTAGGRVEGYANRYMHSSSE